MSLPNLSHAAYGRRKGCSQQYISKLVKAGKIPVDENNRIDPEVADAALAAVSENRPGTLEANARMHAPRAGSGAPRYVETPLSKAKAEDAEYAGKLRKLEYEREVGLLTEAQRVNQATADAFEPILSQLRTISVRASPKVLGETDLRRVQDLIDEEVEKICQETADTLRAMIAGAVITRQ